MERFIAVDNVCAWPNLTMLPGGDVIATIFNQPCHGRYEGDVECWASEDDGRTWRLRGTAAPHEPGTNRMNVAAGLARDGALVVLASGWSNRPRKEDDPGRWTKGEVLPAWVCRSADGGRTWTHEDGAVGPAPGVGPAIPFGDALPLPDGTLGACAYGVLPAGGNSAFFYASGDDGRSWRCRGVMAEADYNETTFVVLPDGSLMAASRTRKDACLDILLSDDHGVTWRNAGPVTLPNQHPGHLLPLADGSILLTYGLRNSGLYGVGTRVYDVANSTWGHPAVLVAFEGATDGGYPASVQSADGAVTTAYYANRVANHERYHMGVVRWRTDGA